METRDPWLAKMVRRAEAGDRVIKGLSASQKSDASQTLKAAQVSNAGQAPESSRDDASRDKIEV